MKKTQLNQILTDISHIAEVSVNYRTKVKPSERHKVTGSADSQRILWLFYEAFGQLEQKEIFSILLLDKSCKALGFLKVGEGDMSSCVVDTPYILRASILAGASNIILCHNHPSGNINPSNADINLTKQIQGACMQLQIKVLDHIILSPESVSYYSFADDGLI